MTSIPSPYYTKNLGFTPCAPCRVWHPRPHPHAVAIYRHEYHPTPYKITCLTHARAYMFLMLLYTIYALYLTSLYILYILCPCLPCRTIWNSTTLPSLAMFPLDTFLTHNANLSPVFLCFFGFFFGFLHGKNKNLLRTANLTNIKRLPQNIIWLNAIYLHLLHQAQSQCFSLKLT